MTDREIMQPAPPPECYTEEEKTAYAFGWWKAMEAQRLAQVEQEPVAWVLPKMHPVMELRAQRGFRVR